MAHRMHPRTRSPPGFPAMQCSVGLGHVLSQAVQIAWHTSDMCAAAQEFPLMTWPMCDFQVVPTQSPEQILLCLCRNGPLAAKGTRLPGQQTQRRHPAHPPSGLRLLRGWGPRSLGGAPACETRGHEAAGGNRRVQRGHLDHGLGRLGLVADGGHPREQLPDALSRLRQVAPAPAHGPDQAAPSLGIPASVGPIHGHCRCWPHILPSATRVIAAGLQAAGPFWDRPSRIVLRSFQPGVSSQ